MPETKEDKFHNEEENPKQTSEISEHDHAG
jgi:hypothetical protein